MNMRLVGMVKLVALALVASPASAQYIPRGQDRDALGQALQGHDFWNGYGQQRVPYMPNPYQPAPTYRAPTYQAPNFGGGGIQRQYGWRQYGW